MITTETETLSAVVEKANDLVHRIVDQGLDIPMDDLKALNKVGDWYERQGGLTVRQMDFVHVMGRKVFGLEEDRAEKMELEARLMEDVEF